MTDAPIPHRRLLHLVGSAVSDLYADLSRLYAADCLDATAGEAETLVAYVAPDGRWRFPTDLAADTIAATETVDLPAALATIVAWSPDAAVPQMFCLPGMTSYRALFDVLRIPLVGNAPAVMALGADKAAARAVVAAAGVPVPEGEVLRRGDRPSLAPPVVVKPVDADNSLGVSLVRDEQEYDAALAAALEHSLSVLVERYIPLGREVRCGVVERDGRLVPLPLEEYAVDEQTHPVRGYADKIRRSDGGDLGLVAKEATLAWVVDPQDGAEAATAAVWPLAVAAHRALGCRQYSLFDFRVDEDGRAWFLEAGLYCSFARTSVVVVMAAAAGIPLTELFSGAVEQAIARERTD